MGSVNHKKIEFVGELKTETVIEFSDFDDFLVWYSGEETENLVQLEPKTKSDLPWTNHDGKGKPVEDYERVEVQFENGVEEAGYAVDYYGWDWDYCEQIKSQETGYKIVGYKVI